MKKTLGIGFVGSGFITRFHLQSFVAVRDAEIRGIWSPHRANAEEVYVGPDAIVSRFEDTIGNPEQWNVKFAKLDSQTQTAGVDGRVVESGDFAITAGGDDGSCYAGSYMATWAPDGGDWKLQVFSWQDVETGMENCQ